MTQQSSPPGPARDVALREVPKWADRYARSRVLLLLLVSAIGLGVSGPISALSAGAVVAWRGGNIVLGLALLAADLAFCAYCLWLVLSKRLKAWVVSCDAWLYRNEGQAAPAAQTIKATWLDTAVGLAFAALACATPIVCTHSGIPIRYLQPVTAAYLVPLIVYQSYRRMLPPVMPLWAALYAAHAILVLAGVPLLANLGPLVSVMLPMGGYLLVAMLASHVYGRYALRRLRRLVRAEGDEEGAQADGGGGDGDGDGVLTPRPPLPRARRSGEGGQGNGDGDDCRGLGTAPTEGEAGPSHFSPGGRGASATQAGGGADGGA